MSDIERWNAAARELDAQWADKPRDCPKCAHSFGSRFNRGQCPKCTFIFYASNPPAGDDARRRVPGFPYPVEPKPQRKREDGFDVGQMADAATRAIERFAESHRDETFYAFAVDADLLCLNSVEAFDACLQRYRTDLPEQYANEDAIRRLKYNTGDWAYQGFATLEDKDGFNSALYSDHYDYGALGNEEATRTSEYAFAVDRLLAALRARDPFHLMRKTKDFDVRRVEHTY